MNGKTSLSIDREAKQRSKICKFDRMKHKSLCMKRLKGLILMVSMDWLQCYNVFTLNSIPLASFMAL